MNRVSFDYDGVFEKKEVQEFAKELIFRGIVVFIVTTRFPAEYVGPNANDFILADANYCGVPFSNIIFLKGMYKWMFFIDNDFIFHLDDKIIETNSINEKTKTPAVLYKPGTNWKEELEKKLKI